jgi:hypothetical protein
MAKHTLSLADVLSFAQANRLDATDLEACKAAYRAHIAEVDGKEGEGGNKRAWNRKMVSLAIIVPIEGKEKKTSTIFFHGLENDRGKILSLAFAEASKVKGGKLNQVQVIIGEQFDLFEAINNSKV